MTFSNREIIDCGAGPRPRRFLTPQVRLLLQFGCEATCVLDGLDLDFETGDRKSLDRTSAAGSIGAPSRP